MSELFKSASHWLYALFGLLAVFYFSYVNIYVWGDDGFLIHLLGYPVEAYWLTWAWICAIAVACASNFVVDGGQKYPIGYIIAAWWIANINMTGLLQWIQPRDIEAAGGTVSILGLELPNLSLDYMAQGGLDLVAMFVIWFLVSRGTIKASVFVVMFCGYLVGNLFGHAFGAYNLMIGTDMDDIGQIYDRYMYLTFTVMLLIQAIGTGGDALLRWSGANVDLYRDIRPYINHFVHRHIHF